MADDRWQMAGQVEESEIRLDDRWWKNNLPYFKSTLKEHDSAIGHRSSAIYPTIHHRIPYLCPMIVIDNILISDEVVEKQFVCDLGKCKGGCCEDGDAGAPLAKEELAMVKKYYEKVKPYLPADAIAEIERKGLYEYNPEFGWVTPTLPSDKEICVYAYREPDGLIKCAFEQAYYDGLIPWKKPISCHLYPIIVKTGKHGDYDRVNYEPREQMCKPACRLGEELKVPVYKFLKEPLIRKYGEEFYQTLDAIATSYFKEKENSKR